MADRLALVAFRCSLARRGLALPALSSQGICHQRRRCAGAAQPRQGRSQEDEEGEEFRRSSYPSVEQLRRHFIQSMVPMVGFGFMDNTVMLHAGNAIDCTLGVTFGLSTLAAAACGQICSDVAGITFGGAIENLFHRLGLPAAGLTAQQRDLPLTKRVGLFGSVVGVVCGCTLGLTNLLIIDTTHAKELKLMAEPGDLEFTVEVSNAMRTDATAIVIEGPVTSGLLSSVTMALNAQSCSVQGIHSSIVPEGSTKKREIFVTRDSDQVADDDLEALAKATLDACRQPDQARTLVERSARLQKENDELRSLLERVQSRLDDHLTKVVRRDSLTPEPPNSAVGGVAGRSTPPQPEPAARPS